MNHLPFDSDLPDFEAATAEEAQDIVINWAANREKKFVATRGRKSNNRVEVKCARSGVHRTSTRGIRNSTTQKCGCPWKLSIKRITKSDGSSVWKKAFMNKWPTNGMYYGNDTHGGTHSLSKTCNQLQAISSFRNIDGKYDKTIQCLCAAGLRPLKIYNYLVKQYNKEKLDVGFTPKDVINKVTLLDESKKKLALDFTDLIIALQNRNFENGVNNPTYNLFYGSDKDENPTPIGLFFLMNNGTKSWKCLGNHTVILYDTKHATNRYGWYLGIISCIDNMGKTKILAVSLTKYQDAETFSWVFDQFNRLLGKPQIIFTDEDAAMKVSIDLIWPLTLHFLCIFHIWKNFYIHIMPLLRNGSKIERKNVAACFWNLAKESDTKFAAEFEEHFSTMVDKIMSIAQNSGANDVSKQFEILFHLCT